MIAELSLVLLLRHVSLCRYDHYYGLAHGKDVVAKADVARV